MSNAGSSKKLPERTYVSLSEALTWMAFGEALEADVLKAQVEGDRPIETGTPEERMRKLWNGELQGLSQKHGAGFFHERGAGLEQLREAWLKLRDIVDQGKVRVRGRYTSTYSTSDASLADVVDLSGDVLSAFSQFDVSTGGIRRQPQGSPDILWRDGPRSVDREFESFAEYSPAADGYLAVELEQTRLVAHVSRTGSCRTVSGRKGRPQGSGGWGAMDAPLVDKMRAMILSTPGLTPHGAAAHFIAEAAGNAGDERKQRRLADRYRKTWAT